MDGRINSSVVLEREREREREREERERKNDIKEESKQKVSNRTLKGSLSFFPLSLLYFSPRSKPSLFSVVSIHSKDCLWTY